MDDSLRERLKLVRKENKLSQVDFAKKISVTQSVVSLMEAGKAAVSIEVLKNLSQTFDVSCDWLIYGRNKYARLSYKRDFIPLINVEAKAGYITQHSDHDYLETLELYKVPGFEKGNYRIFEIEGDSMLPTILPRDKVVCGEVELADIVEGSICVVITAKDIVLKRVYKSPEKADWVILKSDNSNFKNMDIPSGDIHEIWQVQAKVTSSFANNSLEQTKRMDELEGELKEIKDNLALLLNKFDGAASPSHLKNLWPKDLNK